MKNLITENKNVWGIVKPVSFFFWRSNIMMDKDPITEMIKHHEGTVMKEGRHVVYQCTTGKNTIGYGRNLDDRGLSQLEADILLKHDLWDAEQDIKKIFGEKWLMNISTETFAVVMDMRFALGATKFRTFKKFIAAAKEYKLLSMEQELRDSSWYRGVGKNRIDDLIRIMYCGFKYSIELEGK